MNKCTWFPELLDYSMKTFYDENMGTYLDNYFMSREDLEKCIMTEGVEELVDKNICECGGKLGISKIRKRDVGMGICKNCGNCGKIYLVEVKLENVIDNGSIHGKI
jgi:hypothetical protein